MLGGRSAESAGKYFWRKFAGPGTAPETTPETTPESTPETGPETTPETTPDTTPVPRLKVEETTIKFATKFHGV